MPKVSSLSDRDVRSFKIAVVLSGLSQNPLPAMMVSISLRRFDFVPMSKIPFQVFQLSFKFFDNLFDFE